jgi:hypothetical protein
MKRKLKILNHFKSRAAVTFLVLLLLLPLETRSQERNSPGPLFTETVWITTDRQIYLSGDNIPFAAIVLESDSWLPAGLSRVVRVELLDSAGKMISGGEYLLEESRTSNSLAIPAGATSGWYYLRAYTNWMRNRPDLTQSYLPLKIVSPAMIGSEPAATDNSIIITLTPENRMLFPGINRCALFVADASGAGLQYEAPLLNLTGDTVAILKTDPTGWGIVELEHMEGGRYRVAPREEGQEVKLTVVTAGDEESSTQFTFNKTPGRLEVTGRGLSNASTRMLIHRNYTWYLCDSAIVEQGAVHFSVPTYELENGLYQLSLLSDQNEVLFARLFFNGDPTGNYQQLDIGLAASDSSIFEARYNAGKGKGMNALISKLVTSDCPLDIHSLYIPGVPGWQADYTIPAGRDAREGWLIASSYPDECATSFYGKGTGTPEGPLYNSRLIIDERERSYSFMPETRGPALSGICLTGDGKPLPYLPVAATLLTDNTLTGGFTHSSGRFHLPLPNITGSHNVVVVPARQMPEGSKLAIDPGREENISGMPVRRFALSPDEIDYVREADLNRQLCDIYYGDTLVPLPSDVSQKEKKIFYGTPSYRVLLDRYVKLTNVREVIYEVVPRVLVRSSRGIYSLKIAPDPPLPEQYDPLFILDGIPFTELNELLALPPDRIHSIDVVDRLYIHGNAIYSGIIGFNSVNGDLAGLSLPEGSKVVPVVMPLKPEEPVTIRVARGAGEPLLDPTIFWEPWTNEPAGEFTFRPNDNPVGLVTIVSGISSSGQWVYIRKSINFDGENH